MLRLFWSQIQAFSFFHEILQLDTFQGAGFKYDIIFKFQPKNTRTRISGPKFKDFYFCTKPFYKMNSKTLISNMTIFLFKFQPKNTQIRHFWSQVYAFLFFHEILQLDKFEVADFKCGNSLFKIPNKQDKFKHFKYDNSIFKLWPKNYGFLF